MQTKCVEALRYAGNNDQQRVVTADAMRVELVARGNSVIRQQDSVSPGFVKTNHFRAHRLTSCIEMNLSLSYY